MISDRQAVVQELEGEVAALAASELAHADGRVTDEPAWLASMARRLDRIRRLRGVLLEFDRKQRAA